MRFDCIISKLGKN